MSERSETTRDESSKASAEPDAPDLALDVAPETTAGRLDELLRSPRRVAERADLRAAPSFLLAAAVLCALYGAAAGFFQGGEQILLAAVKAPLVIAAGLALCAPSFYIFSALGGTDVSSRWAIVTLAAFGAVLGLMLSALLPVSWLFSVSSRTLVFPSILHAAAWIIALYFGGRFLVEAHGARGGRVSYAWLFLFLLVSFQVASQMRPLLWRAEGMDVFEPRRMFFLEHFSRVVDGEGPNLARSKPEGQAEAAKSPPAERNPTLRSPSSLEGRTSPPPASADAARSPARTPAVQGGTMQGAALKEVDTSK